MQGEETTTSDFNIQQHQKYTSMNYGGQYTKQQACETDEESSNEELWKSKDQTWRRQREH